MQKAWKGGGMKFLYIHVDLEQAEMIGKKMVEKRWRNDLETGE